MFVSPPHRVAVVGNVDAGKSTLLGVLTHGELDNGRGTARQKLFRHKHEMESGRTSSVGNDILGFNQEGRVVNRTDGHGENIIVLSLTLCGSIYCVYRDQLLWLLLQVLWTGCTFAGLRQRS